MAVAEVEIFTRNFHADAAGRGRRPSGAPAPAGAQPRDCVCGGPARSVCWCRFTRRPLSVICTLSLLTDCQKAHPGFVLMHPDSLLTTVLEPSLSSKLSPAGFPPFTAVLLH